MDTTLTVTAAARNFAEVVNRAYYRQETTTLLKNGKPVARVVPVASALKTGKEIAARMAAASRPRLTPEEAESFETDLRAARKKVSQPLSQWD